MLENLVAIIHLICLPLGVVALMQRAKALTLAEHPQQLNRVFYWDNWYGIVALFWIGSGLYRAFGGVDKGTDYYLSNHAFWTKMLLAVILLGAESVPMSTFIRMRVRLAKGLPVSLDRKRVLLLHHWIEVWVIVGMVAMAVLMARGVGAVAPKRIAQTTLAASHPDLDQGAAIYGRRCVACHGTDGSGNGGRLAPNLTLSSSRLAKPDDQLFRSVSEGVPASSMRGFANELNSDEIRNVIAYLRHRFAPEK